MWNKMRRINQSKLKFGTVLLEKDGVIDRYGIQQEHPCDTP